MSHRHDLTVVDFIISNFKVGTLRARVESKLLGPRSWQEAEPGWNPNSGADASGRPNGKALGRV